MSEKKINLDLTPEEALGGTTIINFEEAYKALQAKIKAMSNLRYPFVDVLNCQAALAWMIFSEDGHSSHVERLIDKEMEQLGVTVKICSTRP
jgi:hypothetical protein